MKKKLALFMAAAFAVSSLQTQAVMASSKNIVSNTPNIVPIDTIFIESGGVSRPAPKETEDIKYIMSAPRLVIELENDTRAGEMFRLNLSGAKWFFRDSSSTERFDSAAAGISETYDFGSGAWTANGTGSTSGVYTRNSGSYLSYTLEVSGGSDSTAVVTLTEDGVNGDLIEVPLVCRTWSAEDFLVSIDSSTSPVSMGTYIFGSASASSGDVSYYGASQTASGTTAESDALKSQVMQALNDRRPILFELNKVADRVNIPKDVFKLIYDAGQPIVVTDGVVTVTLPFALMKADNLNNANNVTVVIADDSAFVGNAMKETLRQFDSVNLRLMAKNRTVTISADGKPLETLVSPARITFNMNDMSFTKGQVDKMRAVRFNDGAHFEKIGGSVAATGEFQVDSNILGHIGVIVADEEEAAGTQPPETGAPLTLTLTVGSTRFTLNGQNMTLDAPPTIVDGNTLVPLRFIAEAFGADVSWNDADKTCVITDDGKTLTLRLGQTLPGMNVPPEIINDRLMVPVRYISEQLGADVTWRDDTKTIGITR